MMDEDEIVDPEVSNQEESPLIGGETPNKFQSTLETSSTPGSAQATFTQKRGVNALQLTMMIYFFTSGGPFGIESAVGAAGPLLTLIALIIVPLFWSLPQALMAAELSLMISENGGNVVWVQRAFGNFIGWFNAFNNIACSFSSLALLAVLFVEYIPIEFTAWEAWLLKFAFILFNTVLNILGLRWISRLSTFFLIFILSPFVVEFILVIIRGHLDVHALREIPPVHHIDWALFLSTVIWSYGGFDSMGGLAGEVKGGRATFMTGIIGSFPLIFLNYFFPIFMGYSVHPHYEDWKSGYFTPIAYKVSRWLGAWMVASSALSNFGQFNAAMAPLARGIWAMARSEGDSRKLPAFLGWAWRRPKTGTVRPIASVVFTGSMCMILVLFPFNILVQIFLVIRVCNLACEYAALIRLRYTEPDTPRPFRVPGGNVAAWFLGVPSLLLASFDLYNSPWQVWAAGGVVNTAILIGWGLFRLYRRYFAKQPEVIN